MPSSSFGSASYGWTVFNRLYSVGSLYPIELILNGLAFPHVMTRVHGNGVALFFLMGVSGFVYVTYRLARFAFRVGCAFVNYVAGSRP